MPPAVGPLPPATLEAARLLLQHGARGIVNARQQGGWVPIHAAAQNGEKGHAEFAALLEK